MTKPRLHLLGLFHTVHNQEYSHCAFTGKAFRFSKMLRMYGYEIIEYANEGSESEADEKVVMLSTDEIQKYLKQNKTDFHGNLAATGTPHHALFEERLRPAIKARLRPGDLVCHPFGHAHSILMSDFPKHLHIETGIGYPTLMHGSMRIFESYAWRHYHCAKDDRQGTNYEWVIPNYFDIDAWEPKYEPGKYIAFLGRLATCKGLDTILEIAKYLDGYKIVLCGQGDPTPWQHPNIEYWGPLTGAQRSDFMRNAICSIMPTTFIEPFGGSGVEGMLCGTPLVATDYGAFTETVVDGVTGFRCKTLREWLEAIDLVGTLDRKKVADIARSRYSLEACGAKYDKAFQQIHELYGAGWYTLPNKYKSRYRPAVTA